MNEKKFDWEFKTFGDPKLVNILDKVEKWCLLPNKEKSIITLSGPTERGKTHLLKRVKYLYDEYDEIFPNRKQNYPIVSFVSWGLFTQETLDVRNYFDKIKNSGLILIDDFLSDFYGLKKAGLLNPSNFNKWHQIVISKAFDLLNVRVGKPTFITTNMTEKDIEIIDDRIHSRLFREGGVFIEIPKSLQPFLTREEDV